MKDIKKDSKELLRHCDSFMIKHRAILPIETVEAVNKLSLILEEDKDSWVMKQEIELEKQIHSSLGVCIPEQNLMHKEETNISVPINDDTIIKYSK